MPAFVSESDFLQITDAIIKNIEGGYFHPLMFKDGRLKYDPVYGTSGETMFGLDRVNGAQLALRSPKWNEFWSIIDKQNGSKLWAYNYKGGSVEGALRTLAGQIMYPWFLYLANKYLSEDTKTIVANSKGLKMHFVYAAWNGEGWFRRFAYVINNKVYAGERDANVLFRLAVQTRTGSSYATIRKSGFKIAALAGGFEDLPPSSQVYNFDVIGEIEIPTSVYSINTEADVAVFTTWDDPKELAFSQDASQIATQAIQEAYAPEESTEILQNLNQVLNPVPAPSFNVKLPFLILKSFDYFQQRFTILPQLSSFLKNAFSTKSKVLQFIAVNVLSPQLERAVAMSPSTTAPLSSILDQLRSMGISDPNLFSISDTSLLVERIRETGLVVFDTVNPLQEVEALLEEERSSIANQEFATEEEIFSCPDGDVAPTAFQAAEVDRVADQCCDPVEEEDTELQIPDVIEPELLTEDQIVEFVQSIDQVSSDMSFCGTRKGEALSEIERVKKVQEDLYPLKFFLQKRFEYLEGFENGSIRTTSSFSAADTASLTSTSSAFSIASFFKKNVLFPSDKDSSPQYTNQSGVDPGNPDKFFLIVSEDSNFVKEISTLMKMVDKSESFPKFVYESTNLPKDLKKTSEFPKGTLYSQFYEKYNSAERVNFLFTEEEQGFLTPRPSPAQMLTPEGEQMIRDLRIDEEKAAAFLRSYPELETARVAEKLLALKTSSYFSSVDAYAKEEASTLYGLLKILVSPALLTKLATVKKQREKMIDEHLAMQSFFAELQKKIDTQLSIIAECDECLREQQRNLESFSQPEPEIPVPPSGSDPFGFMPPSPFMPGVSKNKYWKEYTKSLQTVCFMPIPDVQHLRKRLFRYYPVGLQIQVPSPPTVLPTLASGIPDKKISIPFPILWKHITTLSTPAGQFVLWITYCAPYTIAPYLMYIDENLNVVFLSSAKGKVEVPAKSLKWNDDSSLAKSLMERIPGLKIPMKSLPPVDNSVSNKHPDDKKSAIQEVRNRIKSKIDAIDSSPTFTEERIQKRTKLRQFREKISKTLDTRNGYIDISAVEPMLEEVKKMVKDQAAKMLDFEPFEAPKTTSKRSGSETVTELQNIFSKAKSLKKAGTMLESKTVNIEKIFTQKALSVLDTKFGKKIEQDLERDLSRADRELQQRGVKRREEFAKARARVLAEKAKEILTRVASKVDSKAMGYVEVPISLIPHFLPEPARAAIAIEPMPAWMPLVTQAVKKAADTVLEEFVNFEESLTSRIDLGGRLPRARDLMTQTVISGVETVLSSPSIKSLVPFPGWPREISYPSVNMVKQAAKDAANAIWKIKLRMPAGGMPGIKVSPEMVKGMTMPLLDASLDLIFARMLQEFSRLPFEQNDSSSIKLQRTLQFTKSILGNDVWDLNEQDIKRVSSQFVRDALVRVDKTLGDTLEVVDSTKKTFNSILKKLAPFSKQKTERKEEPSLDIGGAVATAFFKTITAKFVSGELPSPPYPVVLLACATGLPGWTIFTKTDPFRAIEKIPPYERISLKSVPFVIFLDMIAATAQRYGGIGSNYVTPYFVPDA